MAENAMAADGTVIDRGRLTIQPKGNAGGSLGGTTSMTRQYDPSERQKFTKVRAGNKNRTEAEEV